MPRRTTVIDLPFLEGEHGEVDPKILPDGYLTRCKNVRLRKDGRWGVRADFDALGNDTNGSTDLVPRDVVAVGDALCALGDSSGVSGDTALWDVHDYTGNTPAEWSPSTTQVAVDRRLSGVTNLRTIPAYSATDFAASQSCTRIDCAAAGGVIGFAYEASASFSYFRFIRASDGATLLITTLSGGKPRICSVGTTFFFTAISGTDLLLSKFSPTTDAAATSLTGIAGSGTIYDLVTNRAGTGFWIAYNTATPTTTIQAFNSSGVAGSAITGPAVAYSYLAIRETATRMNLVTVLPAGTLQLRSYTLAGALPTGPTTLGFTVHTSTRQPGIVDATFGATEAVYIAAEQSASPDNQVLLEQVDTATHADIAVGVERDDCFLGAKPLSGASNYHKIFAGIQTDGAFFSALLQETDQSGSSVMGAYTNKFSATKQAADHTPQLARDSSTGKCYWPTLTVNDSGNARPALFEFDWLSSNRRQTAQVAELLYIGAGALGIYDRRTLVSAGFFEKPRIVSATPSNGAGSLPSNTSLLLATTWEGRDSRGNIVESDISDVTTVAMGAADDTIAVVPSRPHGLRLLTNPTCVVYRSIDGINQLRRAADGAAGTTITLTDSDAIVRTGGVIYTQAGRGSLSGTLPHEAPLPADFIWKFGARLLCANASQAFVSKELFPGEEVTFSGAVGFLIPSIPERIYGVAALDQRGLIFSSERIYQFSGDGPNDNGEGSYSEPVPIPGSTGLMTWQSLVETPIGLFFQGSNGQLWVLPRDGSPPVWIGQPVRDTLVSYPNVTSATLVTKEQLVCFTCNNSGNTDSRIVCYDLRAKTWIVDELTWSTPITSACSYNGRLAILSAGVVYTEKTTVTPNSFIEHSLLTGRVKPFASEWGKFCTIGLVGEYRGDCLLRCKVSYDDGKTYTTMSKVFSVTAAAGYSVGDTVELEWNPRRRKSEHIRVEFAAITNGTATEGFVFNKWRLAVMKNQGMSRTAAALRG